MGPKPKALNLKPLSLLAAPFGGGLHGPGGRNVQDLGMMSGGSFRSDS